MALLLFPGIVHERALSQNARTTVDATIALARAFAHRRVYLIADLIINEIIPARFQRAPDGAPRFGDYVRARYGAALWMSAGLHHSEHLECTRQSHVICDCADQ